MRPLQPAPQACEESGEGRSRAAGPLPNVMRLLFGRQDRVADLPAVFPPAPARRRESAMQTAPPSDFVEFPARSDPAGRRAALRRLGGALALGAVVWPAARAAEPAVVEVEIRAYSFIPAELRVPVGSTVRWVNREKRTAHSVRFTGPQGFESPRFFPDEHWTHRFDQAGRFPYECGPHPEMKGVVVVE